MRGVYLAAIAIVTIWLQASFLGALRPFGLIPNLLIILVLIAGSICTASQTVAIAMFSGLMLDLASGADFGLRTAFYSLAALLIVVLRRNGADLERLSMMVAVVAGGTLLYNAAVVASLVISGVGLPWPAIGSRVAAEAAINIVLLVLIRLPLSWLLIQATSPFGWRQGRLR